MSRRGRREDGAVLVEAAFVLPLVILFMLAMLDLGLWGLSSTQATNSARDGARAGVIDYEFADVPGTPAHDAIVAAAAANIPDNDLDGAVTVRCVDADGDPVTGGCAAATPNVDRVEVTVAWSRDLITPVASMVGVSDADVNGTSSMVIVGKPFDDSILTGATTTTTTLPPTTTTTTTTTLPITTTTTIPITTTIPVTTTTIPITTTTTIPTTCTVQSITIITDPVEARNNGRLTSDLTLTVVTNGAIECDLFSIELFSPNGSSHEHTVCSCIGPEYTWTEDKNAHSFWTAGTGRVDVLDLSNTVVLSQTFEVE